MKSLFLAITLLFGFALNLFAQSGPSFDLAMTRLGQTEQDWNFVMTINLTENLQDGLALNLPDKVKALPIAVELNGEQLWLKNADEQPQRASTLTWFEDDSGRVILRFSENRLNSGDRLVVTCTVNMKEQPSPDKEVILNRLLRSGESVEATTEVMGNSALPIIEETN